jgi:pimeloyl-ACP methyl ester carboxylesterase
MLKSLFPPSASPFAQLPAGLPGVQNGDPLGLSAQVELMTKRLADTGTLWQLLANIASMHLKQMTEAHGGAPARYAAALQHLMAKPGTPQQLATQWAEYLADAAQRGILFLDVMREVGNRVVEQQQGNSPPVLVYDYETVIDGRSLERPVNYALVRILPPAGVVVDPMLRPYMIIDPRAGHGAGIGGFKSDSQVGVALAHGHAVYFTIFFPRPVPGQTLADVCAAEGLFVREVAERHPGTARPVVVGNCQGGWAAMLLAACNPHVTGPLVINGAPLSYWAGVHGKNPLRYMGGLAGGAAPALFSSDLGNGVFDGANLVQNFESMNPGNTWFRKYYNLYANIDTEAERFIGFEKWWSGFYLMNEAEIRWIVENLFVGNKLQRGEARLGGRGTVDLRNIKAPIIVFASEGDDITPPQQALNWIPALYQDEREITARGQRIIYMVHEDIGHLGIFVSAKVAKKEHDRIISTLEAIEALAPGLYEMTIESKTGEGIHAQYVVGFYERTMDDLRAYDDGRVDEESFVLVARMSEFGVNVYEMFARPWVRAMSTPASAQALVHTHPMRARRYALSDINPAMKPVAGFAQQVRAARKPAAADNPYVQAEHIWADMFQQALDFWRDLRGAGDELKFFGLWSNPFLARLTDPRGAEPNAGLGETLRELPQVQAALMNITRGGYAEAVIRMLILLAKSRGSVRESRLERSNAILHAQEPFRSMGNEWRARVIAEQALIVDFAPDDAVRALTELLPEADRQRAVEVVQEIAGASAEMNDATARMLVRLRTTLGLEPRVLGTAATTAPSKKEKA